MVKGKSPSDRINGIDGIYDDRSAPGSPDELDEYGVWVKSGPQDFEEISGDESADISLDLSGDFSSLAGDEFPDFEDIEAGEAFAADSGDFDLSESVFEESEDLSREGQDTIEIDIPPDTETLSADADDEVMDFGFLPEIGADALDSPESGDFSIPEGFSEWEDFSISEDIEESADSGADADETSFAEIKPGEEETPDFEILEAGFPEESAAETGASLESGVSSETEVSTESASDFEIDFEDIPDLPEISLEELPAADETPAASPFLATDNADEGSAVPASEGEAAETGVSTRLLLQIVNELSSIKGELADLKKELAVSKGEIFPKGPSGQSAERPFDKAALVSAADDNDEKIALAGETESGGADGALTEEPEVPDGVLPSDDEDKAVEAGPEPVPSGEASPEAADLTVTLEDELPGEIGEIKEVEELAGPVSESGELAADLLPELPAENDEDAAAFDSAFDSAIDDSFDQVIPEGFEEKSPAPTLHTPDAPDEDDFFDAVILPEDESPEDENPETELSGEDTSTDVPAGGDTGADMDFGLLPDLDEASPDGVSEIPDFSMDLDAEFDSAAFEAEEDIAIDIPADSENGNGGSGESDEPDDFDFADEILESLDIALPEDSEEIPGGSFGEDDLSSDLSHGSSNDLPEDGGEFLPDLVPEDEPALEAPSANEWPVEDEYLSPEFDDFSITPAEEIPAEELLTEEIPEAETPKAEITEAEIPKAEIPPEPAPEPPVSEPPARKPEPVPSEPAAETAPATKAADTPPDSPLSGVPVKVREELRTVLSYMDRLLDSLPEEKIEEFARSEYFDTYKKLFEDLGLS
jgi:hypothetical protein